MSILKKLFKLLRPEPIASRDELLAVCSGVAVVLLKRDTLCLQRDAEIQLVKDKYDAEIETLQQEAEGGEKRIRTWAVTYRKIEFGDKQSLVIAGHELAFHQSPGKVATVEDAKEQDILDLLMALDDAALAQWVEEEFLDDEIRVGDLTADQLRESYVRVTPALNKAAVLRDWRLNRACTRLLLLRLLHLNVKTEETFKFTPARTELPPPAESHPVATETGETVLQLKP